MKDITEIPKGCYCYDENGTCPYWSLDKNHEEQNNGYCSFLEEGDWDSNSNTIEFLARQEDGTYLETKTSGDEMGFYIGLLWDKVKLCNVNEYTEEELLEEGIFSIDSDICNLLKDNTELI